MGRTTLCRSPTLPDLREASNTHRVRGRGRAATSDPALAYAAPMANGDVRRLRITGYDGAGAEGGFRVRVVTVHDGRLGCSVPPDVARLVEHDPRVRLEALGEFTADVLRSGRLFAEVHGRLRAARRLPRRTQSGPVLLMHPQ